jgi:hypothetical protein
MDRNQNLDMSSPEISFANTRIRKFVEFFPSKINKPPKNLDRGILAPVISSMEEPTSQ